MAKEVNHDIKSVRIGRNAEPKHVGKDEPGEGSGMKTKKGGEQMVASMEGGKQRMRLHEVKAVESLVRHAGETEATDEEIEAEGRINMENTAGVKEMPENEGGGER
ncbi:hypothetical protein vseg_012634 [Gypsophila vaccaria]